MTIPPNDRPEQASAPKREIVSVPLTPREKRMHEDLQWAAHSPDVQQHLGKAVVIRDQRIIAVDENRGVALDRAVALEGCPWWEFVVEIVPPLELWEVPLGTFRPTQP